MEQVFDPDVVVTEQALARKERFKKNKKLNIITIPKNTDDLLPSIWFDDLGEITAVTYDPEFQPDSSWHTYDFDLITLRMIKGNNPSYYIVKRIVENDTEISYRIVLRKSTMSRQVTQDTGLTHAKKLRPDVPVDIEINVTEDRIKLNLTDIGNNMIAQHPEKYLKNDILSIHVTEPMNVHLLIETFEVALSDLIVDEVVFETKENYTLKSLFCSRPFMYGRV